MRKMSGEEMLAQAAYLRRAVEAEKGKNDERR